MTERINLTGEVTHSSVYQAALKAYSKNLYDAAKSMQKVIDISNIANVRLANQIKLPDFSKMLTPPLAYKESIAALANKPFADFQPIIKQLQQAPNLSAFNMSMPTSKLISNVAKSAALANRLSFSNSVLSKSLLDHTIKISSTGWDGNQYERKHQSNFQSALNSQTDSANSKPTSSMINQETNSISTKVTQQENIREKHKQPSQTIFKHELPSLSFMLDIAGNIILAMQVYHFNDEYIQIAYTALMVFIVKQYFDSNKQ